MNTHHHLIGCVDDMRILMYQISKSCLNIAILKQDTRLIGQSWDLASSFFQGKWVDLHLLIMTTIRRFVADDLFKFNRM